MKLAALVQVIDREDDVAVKSSLSCAPGLAQMPVAAGHEDTQTLLHRAIPSDGVPLLPAHPAIVQELLDAGAEVDALGGGLFRPNDGAYSGDQRRNWASQHRNDAGVMGR